MLDYPTNAQYTESTRQEEHRLLNELTRIDKRLKDKMDTKVENDEWRLWERRKQSDAFNHKKWYNEKDSNHCPIYNTNMEYFSEICTEDIDDDSLFDPQSNLLAPTKPLYQNQHGSNSQLNKNCVKTKEMKTGHEKENLAQNSQSQKQITSNSQIIKEINYAYKKEIQDRPQPIPKMALPPKNSKITSSSKCSTLPSKSTERKSSINLRRPETTPQNKLKTVPSKEKYKLKNVIVEQGQNNQDDPNQFKFHTFEPYMESNLNTDASQKSIRVYAKKKNEYQDKNSLQCTFKPTILKKSSEIAKSNKTVVERLSTSGQQTRDQKKPYQPQHKQTLNRNRMEQMSQPRRLKTQYNQKIEEVPSFRPSLSKKSLEQMSNCMFDVATRNQLWQKQRSEKIEKMREEEEKEKEKRQNCTYSPSLCHYKGDNAPNLSRFGRQGVENYFERLSSFNKVGSRTKLHEQSKENRQSCMNMSKEGYSSKGVKKQKYEDAVRQLHSRIMGLKI